MRQDIANASTSFYLCAQHTIQMNEDDEIYK